MHSKKAMKLTLKSKSYCHVLKECGCRSLWWIDQLRVRVINGNAHARALPPVQVVFPLRVQSRQSKAMKATRFLKKVEKMLPLSKPRV